MEQCTALINKYNINIMSYLEHGLNMAEFKASEIFDSLFDAEIDLRSVTGHNSNESLTSQHQQGRSGILAINKVLEYYINGGTDCRDSGRWTSINLNGSAEHCTRMILVRSRQAQ